MLHTVLKHQRFLTVFLLTAFLFFSPGSVWAEEGMGKRHFPGDQSPAENYQIGAERDVFTEKKIEASIYPLNLFLVATVPFTAPGGAGAVIGHAVGAKMIKDVIEGYGIDPSLAKPSALVWVNWPPNSFHFDSAPEHTYRFISGAVANISASLLNWFANQAFFLTKAFVLIGNNVVVLAFDTGWVKAAADWIAEVVRMVAGPLGGSGEFSFASALFLLALCGLALCVAVHLVRARVVSALVSVLVAAVCLAGTFFYAANCNRIVSGVADFTDSIAGAAMSASSLLYTEKGDAFKGMPALQKGIAGVTNTAWTAVVACPWGWGQFGTTDPKDLSLTDAEWEELRSRVDKDYSRKTPPSGVGRRLDRSDLDAMQKSGALYADTFFLGSSEELKGELLEVLSDPDIDHGRHPGTVVTCGPGSGPAWRHLQVAALSVIPALAYLILTLCIGVPVIFAQFMLMLLFVFLPFGLLIGVAGDAGRNATVAYLKMMFGYFVTKIVYGFYLGTVLFFAAGIARALL